MSLLTTFIDLFHTLADDFAAAELCLRAIDLDDRLAHSTVADFGPADYSRVARAYHLLVTFYAELERYDDAADSRTLSYLEASKETNAASAESSAADPAPSVT